MIQDYATLQAAVADWLKRSDLTSAIPTFIQLAEVRVNRDLKAYQMITEATGDAADGLIPLPTDFLSAVRVSVTIGGTEALLEPLSSARALNDRQTALAYGYVTEGENLRLIGGDAAPAYTLTYYAKVPPLSDNTNWLILAAPDIYLYGTLLEAAPYLRHDERIQIWVGAYKAAVDALQRQSDDARWSPSAGIRLAMRTP